MLNTVPSEAEIAEIEDQRKSAPLTNRTTRAAIASGTAQIITRFLAVVLSIATARALEPREVGTLGLAVILAGTISMIAFYPETAAIAARGDEDHKKFAVASVIAKVFLVASLLVVVTVTAPLLSQYLAGKEGGESQLVTLLAVLLWVPVLELLGAYPRVILQRRLDLNWASAAALLQPTVFVALAVVLLWNGYGYFGVAWASVIGTATATLLLWYRLWLSGEAGWDGLPSRAALRETLGGSLRVFVGGFGGFLGERLDNLLVSATIGPSAMSFYSMAWNGSRTPANVFGSTIGFVLIPTLSRIQGEPARVRRAVGEALRHSYLLLAPVCAALFVSAPLIIIYVLGAKWLPMVPCLRIMCVTVLVIPVLHASNALLVSAGRAQLTGIATSVHLLALITLIPILSGQWALVGAALGDLVSMVALTVTLYVTAWLATGHIDLEMMSAFLVPIVAAVLAGALAWQVGILVGQNALRLAIELSSVGFGYLLFLFTLGGRSRLNDLFDLLRGARRRTVAA